MALGSPKARWGHSKAVVLVQFVHLHLLAFHSDR